MKNTELVIMAAGMGSRFGGLKQIAPFGPNGEAIVDFSVYDAKRAGFDKAIIIIKKAIEKDFRESCGKRLEKMIDVEYAFQEIDNIPEGYKVPEGRVKPWGTGHAVLSAKGIIKNPFAVINADDYYGASSFKILHDHLISSNETCMVGYKLGNTITENGTVSRGVCKTENGYLTDIEEITAIDKNSGIPLDTTVSMNMWGFAPDMLDYLEFKFREFLDERINEEKSEFYLPFAVRERMAEKGEKVKVLTTAEQWYGVTYKDDTPTVKAAMDKFIEEGKYDF